MDVRSSGRRQRFRHRFGVRPDLELLRRRRNPAQADTGIAVWLLARQTFHIGLSGVVFGLVTFVMANGFFRRNIRSMVLAMIVFLLYSGMLAGVFPMKEGISWKSHLFGAIAGVFTAYYYKEEIELEEEDPYAQEESGLQSESYFLPRDIFEKTKEERRREAEDNDDTWFSNSTF